jgi:hypothetical protein
MTDCELLDDYLDGVLAGADRERFEQHAFGCGACGRAVRWEQRLGRLARSAAENEFVPSTLTTATRVAVERAHLRQRLAWCAAAAAMLLVIVLPFAMRRHLISERTIPAAADATSADSTSTPGIAISPPANVVRLAADSEKRYIAVPQATRDPGITFVMLYPTTSRAEEATTRGRSETK